MKRMKSQEVVVRGEKFFIAEDGKEIGRAFLYVLKNGLHKKPFGLMEDVFVTKSRRGQGLGKLLIGMVISEARKNKCYKLIATSRKTRPRAHKLYKKIGFEEWGEEFRIDL